MFRKTVSDLPFSPSLEKQLEVQLKHLAKEKPWRKASLTFALLLFFVQVIVITLPAQASLAASPNDLVFGANSKSDIQAALTKGCDNSGRCDIDTIYQQYGINSTNLMNGKLVIIRANEESSYWVLGRSPRGKGNEVAIQIRDEPLLYGRNLYSWGTRGLPAIKVMTGSGTRWVLLQGGDIVTQGSSSLKLGSMNESIQNSADSVVLHDTARNITGQATNAGQLTARAGDNVEYTLTTKNIGIHTISNYVMQDNMSDVLQYADLIDASGGTYTTNPVATLSWTIASIPPGQTVDRTVLTAVKSPIPNTPASITDPLSNDLKMVNVYGDTTQVMLPRGSLKRVEELTQQLPGVSNAVDLTITGLVLLLSAYLYYRNRLMTKELGLISREFNQGQKV